MTFSLEIRVKKVGYPPCARRGGIPHSDGIRYEAHGSLMRILLGLYGVENFARMDASLGYSLLFYISNRRGGIFVFFHVMAGMGPSSRKFLRRWVQILGGLFFGGCY